MEDAGNNGDVKTIDENTPKLLEMYSEIEKEMSQIPEISGKDKEEDIDKPLISEHQLMDAYNTILEVCSMLDYDTLIFILDSVNTYRVSGEDDAIIKKIGKLAYKLDWDGISKLVSSRLGK